MGSNAAHFSTLIDVQSNCCAIRTKLDSIVNIVERLVISTIVLTLCSIHDIVCSIYKTAWEYIKAN